MCPARRVVPVFLRRIVYLVLFKKTPKKKLDAYLKTDYYGGGKKLGSRNF